MTTAHELWRRLSELLPDEAGLAIGLEDDVVRAAQALGFYYDSFNTALDEDGRNACDVDFCQEYNCADAPQLCYADTRRRYLEAASAFLFNAPPEFKEGMIEQVGRGLFAAAINNEHDDSVRLTAARNVGDIGINDTRKVVGGDKNEYHSPTLSALAALAIGGSVINSTTPPSQQARYEAATAISKLVDSNTPMNIRSALAAAMTRITNETGISDTLRGAARTTLSVIFGLEDPPRPGEQAPDPRLPNPRQMYIPGLDQWAMAQIQDQAPTKKRNLKTAILVAGGCSVIGGLVAFLASRTGSGGKGRR